MNSNKLNDFFALICLYVISKKCSPHPRSQTVSSVFGFGLISVYDDVRHGSRFLIYIWVSLPAPLIKNTTFCLYYIFPLSFLIEFSIENIWVWIFLGEKVFKLHSQLI